MTKQSSSLVPMHKRMAMGQTQNLKTGGSVRPSKTGIPDTPLENARRANGIPGMKKGGSCSCGQ